MKLYYVGPMHITALYNTQM